MREGLLMFLMVSNFGSVPYVKAITIQPVFMLDTSGLKFIAATVIQGRLKKVLNSSNASIIV